MTFKVQREFRGSRIKPKPLSEALDRQKVVVLCYAVGGIGDLLAHVPTLNALAHLFKHRLTIVCESSGYYQVLAAIPNARIIGIECKRVNREIVFDVSALSSMVDGCDLLISFNQEDSTCTRRLVDQVNSCRSLGFFSYYTEVLQYSVGRHVMELPFAVPLGIDPSLDLETFAKLPTSAFHQVQALHVLRNVSLDRKLMMLHTDTNESKMWTANLWNEVLERFLESHPEYFVIILGMSCSMMPVKGYEERVLSCVGLSLATSLALIGRGHLFLGIDSCFLHAADLWRVPGVALFGPTDATLWGFHFSDHQHVLGRTGKMGEISSESVASALEELLGNLCTDPRPSL